MIYTVCSFYDLKANDYGVPFHVPTRDMAVRLFQDLISRGTDLMSRYPGDFFLYVLGTYDSSTGLLKSLPQPERVCSGDSVLLSFSHQGAAVGDGVPLKSQSAEPEVSVVDGMED